MLPQPPVPRWHGRRSNVTINGKGRIPVIPQRSQKPHDASAEEKSSALVRWNKMSYLGTLRHANSSAQNIYAEGGNICAIIKPKPDIPAPELEILQQIDQHQHIASILDSFSDENGTVYYVVQSAELTLGDIFDFIPWSEGYIRLIAKPVNLHTHLSLSHRFDNSLSRFIWR
jgi:serine/threonine protein kinase